MTTTRRDRLAIFVDAGNMFYVQKAQGWFIDWGKFYRHFTANRDTVGAYFFTATPSADQPERVKAYRRFKRFLQYTGYRVIDKEVRILEDKSTGQVRVKGNLDIELVFRLLATIDSYDEAIIVGGDADYIPVIEHLVNVGKTVRIVGSQQSTSIDLINTANKYTEMSDIQSAIERTDRRPEDAPRSAASTQDGA